MKQAVRKGTFCSKIKNARKKELSRNRSGAGSVHLSYISLNVHPIITERGENPATLHL